MPPETKARSTPLRSFAKTELEPELIQSPVKNVRLSELIQLNYNFLAKALVEGSTEEKLRAAQIISTLR